MVDNNQGDTQPSNVVSLPDDIKPEDFPELLEQTLITFNDGDVIEGTIVRIDRNEVMVDVGSMISTCWRLATRRVSVIFGTVS